MEMKKTSSRSATVASLEQNLSPSAAATGIFSCPSDLSDCSEPGGKTRADLPVFEALSGRRNEKAGEYDRFSRSAADPVSNPDRRQRPAAVGLASAGLQAGLQTNTRAVCRPLQ